MIATALVLLIAALHFYILLMEMVWWQTPRVRRIFRTSEEFALATKAMAANQGLYNGFLASGLLWAVWLSLAGQGRDWAIFFLLCVAVAGLYGAATVSRRILFVQTVPAAAALAAIFVGI
jgi:putative membrane protein